MKENNTNLLSTKGFISSEVFGLRSTLLEWFDNHGRQWIPWKLKLDGNQVAPGELINPYPVWIAEVMLQQTQIKVVLPYWEKWMKTFPDVDSLSKSFEQEVLLVWQGLGYYSRARRIHEASKMLMNSIVGKKFLDPDAWPKDLETWMSLPGLGKTTAGSIISSSFDYPSAILDGNVKRVLSRLVASTQPIDKCNSYFWSISEQLLDSKRPRDFNQALMDLGSKVCTKHNPRCNDCPWQKQCIAYSLKDPTRFPVKSNRRNLSHEVIGLGIIINEHRQILIAQRLNEGLLGGLWEFPGGKQEKEETIEYTIFREMKEELDIEVEVGIRLITLDHSYTHKKLKFIVHICKLLSGEPIPLASQKIRWVDINSLSKFPFPAANVKIINALKQYLN